MRYVVAVTIDAQHRLSPDLVQILLEAMCDAATAAGIPAEVQILREI